MTSLLYYILFYSSLKWPIQYPTCFSFSSLRIPLSRVLSGLKSLLNHSKESFKKLLFKFSATIKESYINMWIQIFRHFGKWRRFRVDLTHCNHCQKKLQTAVCKSDMRGEGGGAWEFSFYEPETTQAEKGANRSSVSKPKSWLKTFLKHSLAPILCNLCVPWGAPVCMCVCVSVCVCVWGRQAILWQKNRGRVREV